ncbi:hypothetical protein ABK040_006970 [Willaertia magna]
MKKLNNISNNNNQSSSLGLTPSSSHHHNHRDLIVDNNISPSLTTTTSNSSSTNLLPPIKKIKLENGNHHHLTNNNTHQLNQQQVNNHHNHNNNNNTTIMPTKPIDEDSQTIKKQYVPNNNNGHNQVSHDNNDSDINMQQQDYHHIICITPKQVSDSIVYSIVVRFDESSPYHVKPAQVVVPTTNITTNHTTTNTTSGSSTLNLNTEVQHRNPTSPSTSHSPFSPSCFEGTLPISPSTNHSTNSGGSSGHRQASPSSTPFRKDLQFLSPSLNDLKKLIDTINEKTNINIKSCFIKKTLGTRQKIIPLSAKQQAVFEGISVGKPVSMYITTTNNGGNNNVNDNNENGGNKSDVFEFDYSNMYNESGNENFRNSKYEEAVRDYDIALQRYPDEVKSLSNRSLCFTKINKYFEAIKGYTQIIHKLEKSQENEFYEKSLFRRSRSCYALVTSIQSGKFTGNLKELNEFINHHLLKDKLNLQQYDAVTKLYYIGLRDCCNYVKIKGYLNNYTELTKDKFDLYDIHHITSIYYLLHKIPNKELDICLVSKILTNDLQNSCIIPKEIFTPKTNENNIDPNLLKEYPFCCKEWFNSNMKENEELFITKLWKPFYENNEDIDNKSIESKFLYSFILFVGFKYLFTKSNLLELIKVEDNLKFMKKMLTFLAYGAQAPPKIYLYIENKQLENENKLIIKDYISNNRLEFIYIQVKDFIFVVECKQPAASTFSSQDSSYGDLNSRVKHTAERFIVKVGKKVPEETLAYITQ